MYQTIVNLIAVLFTTLSMTTGVTKAAAIPYTAITPPTTAVVETIDTNIGSSTLPNNEPVLQPVNTEPAQPTENPDEPDSLVDIEDAEIPLAPTPDEPVREWPPLPCCTTVEFVDGMVVLTNTHGGYLCRAIVTEDDFYAGNWVFEDVIGPAIPEEETNGTEIEEPTTPEIPDEGTDIQEYEVPLAPAPVREMPPLPCCTEVEFRDGMVYLTNTHGGYYSYAIVTEDDFYAGNWSWE